jgi:UMF1 family MFS transporter
MAGARAGIDRGALSWAMFEWARNPYVLCCVIYVLGPYIANVVLGGGPKGQATFSAWQTIAGVIVACTAPFLGATADRLGHRKPLLAVSVAIMAPALFAEYWAMPDGAGGLPIWGLEIVAIIVGVAYTWTEVLHNSMLTTAAKPSQLSQLSGLGLALGNAGGLLVLIFVLFAFALPGQFPIRGLPAHPLFGLDPATHETARIVAPISAVWLVLFALPLFLFTPDRNPSGESVFAAFRDGVGNVFSTLRKLVREYRNVARFLLTRMVYVDGTTAIVIYGGVYAQSALHWNFVEMLVFGVSLSIFAVLGGFVASWLDHAFGCKRAIAIEVIVSLICLMIEVSMSPTQMFFLIPVDPAHHVWSGPIFQTAPEVAYLAASLLIAVAISATYASSRALVAMLAPEGMEGQIFGLYSLSGSASAWLAPMLVTIFTSVFQSFRAGFGSIGILLVVGFVLLLFVKPPKAA